MMNAIILAGGQARRMNGTRKAFLRLQGTTFLQRLREVLRPYVGEVLVVTNEPDLYEGQGVRVVVDERPGVGPLMGIYCGLKASASAVSFVTAVDTPLLAGALVDALARRGEGCDVRVPRWGGRLEPLCAVYSRLCLPAIEEVLEGEPASPPAGTSVRIIAFFPRVSLCVLEEEEVRKLDPEGRSFLNVNTPEDYERLRASFG